MKGNKKRGIGLKYALNGLKEAIINEKNFRIHLIVALFVIGFSVYYRLSIFEWIFIIVMIQFVFITELMNSIVERMIDYLKPEIHPEAKVIKDVAAAVVLIAALASVIVGCIIFIPKIFS